MKKIMRLGVGIAALAMALAATVAQANVFSWSYTDGGSNVGSGTFITGSTGNPWALTGVTGVADGFTITGLSWYAGADNLLYSPATADPGYVDFGGISFTTAGGPDFNLGGSYVAGQYVLNDSSINPVGYAGVPGSTPVQLTVSSVPEPAAFGLLGLGMLGLGWAKRKQFAAV